MSIEQGIFLPALAPPIWPAGPVTARGWQMPGASADIDFANNRSWPLPMSSMVSFARSSSGMAEDADGNWTDFGAGVLRRNSRGLLMEETRANRVRNPSFSGAVVGLVGSGGVLPDNWFLTNSPTVTIVGTGVKKGIRYVDVRLQGGAITYAIEFENATAIVASEGQTYTGSFFCELVGGSMNNISGIQCGLIASGVGTNFSASFVPDGTFRRQTVIGTMQAGTTAVRPRLRWVGTGSHDITLRIGFVQCELGVGATSLMDGNGSAAVRSEDAATLIDAGKYLSSERGSIFVEFTPSYVGGSNIRNVFALVVDGTNRTMGYIEGGIARYSMRTNNALQFILQGTNSLVDNGTYKSAYRWSPNDSAVRYPASIGSPANSTTSVPMTGQPTLYIGRFSVGQQLNGYIRRIAIFPTGLNDNLLDAMVA